MPALVTPVENANQTLDKVILTLNRAGSNPRNPILSGLGGRVEIHLATNDQLRGVYVFQDRANKGTNHLASALPIAPGVWAFDLQHGGGLSVGGTPALGATRNFFRVETKFGSFEREFWVKSRDYDAVMLNAEAANDPTTLDPVPVDVDQIAEDQDWIEVGADWLVSWNDEFQVLHKEKNELLDPGFLKAYGGAKFVSVFDRYAAPVAQNFNQNNPTAIPSGPATVESVLAVAGVTTPLIKVRVAIHITHTFNADLDIFLVGPDGTEVELSSDNGGNGDGYGTGCGAKVMFDDDAAALITGAPAGVITGTWKPEGALSAFAGKSGSDVNGNWKLKVVDDSAGDSGSIVCWTLELTPQNTAAGTEGVGVQVNPIDEEVIDTLHEIEVQNTPGLKDGIVRFRAKQGSPYFVDVPFQVRVNPPTSIACNPPIAVPCADVLLKLGTGLPENTPGVPSVVGVPTVPGVEGTPLDQDLLVIAMRAYVAGSAPKMRIRKWSAASSATDLGGTQFGQVGGDLDYTPMSIAALDFNPIPSQPPYGTAKVYAIALSVSALRAEGVALLEAMILDGDVISMPMVVAGPRLRDLAFYPPGEAGGGPGCCGVDGGVADNGTCPGGGTMTFGT